jgi:hypothetical protein
MVNLQRTRSRTWRSAQKLAPHVLRVRRGNGLGQLIPGHPVDAHPTRPGCLGAMIGRYISTAMPRVTSEAGTLSPVSCNADHSVDSKQLAAVRRVRWSKYEPGAGEQPMTEHLQAEHEAAQLDAKGSHGSPSYILDDPCRLSSEEHAQRGRQQIGMPISSWPAKGSSAEELARRARVNRIEHPTMLGEVVESVVLNELERIPRLWLVVDPNDLGEAGAMVSHRRPAGPRKKIKKFCHRCLTFSTSYLGKLTT